MFTYILHILIAEFRIIDPSRMLISQLHFLCLGLKQIVEVSLTILRVMVKIIPDYVHHYQCKTKNIVSSFCFHSFFKFRLKDILINRIEHFPFEFFHIPILKRDFITQRINPAYIFPCFNTHHRCPS